MFRQKVLLRCRDLCYFLCLNTGGSFLLSPINATALGLSEAKNNEKLFRLNYSACTQQQTPKETSSKTNTIRTE